MKSKVVKKSILKIGNTQYEGMNPEASKQIKGSKKMYNGIKDKINTVLISDKRRKGQTVKETRNHEIIENKLIKSKIKSKYKEAHKYAEQHETKPLKKTLGQMLKMRKK